jgi:hypothetical protein
MVQVYSLSSTITKLLEEAILTGDISGLIPSILRFSTRALQGLFAQTSEDRRQTQVSARRNGRIHYSQEPFSR